MKKQLSLLAFLGLLFFSCAEKEDIAPIDANQIEQTSSTADEDSMGNQIRPRTGN